MNRLYMRVEPSDSSYMPSLVVVSGGDSCHTMKELKTVNISASETLVTLLQDVAEVRFIIAFRLLCIVLPPNQSISLGDRVMEIAGNTLCHCVYILYIYYIMTMIENC